MSNRITFRTVISSLLTLIIIGILLSIMIGFIVRIVMLFIDMILIIIIRCCVSLTKVILKNFIFMYLKVVYLEHSRISIGRAFQNRGGSDRCYQTGDKDLKISFVLALNFFSTNSLNFA